MEEKRELEDTFQRVPNFRALGRHQEGFTTEIGTSDADKIVKAIEVAESKPVHTDINIQVKQNEPVIHTIAGYRIHAPLPDTSRIGWTSFSTAKNPGGSLNVKALEKEKDNERIHHQYILKHLLIPVDCHWEDYGVIFVVGIGFWILARWGYLSLIAGFLFLGLKLLLVSYYSISQYRFIRNARDDINRGLSQAKLRSDSIEYVEWMNSLIHTFWLVFEPLLSAYVKENIDTYLIDYLPGILDSVKLTTFTLGTTPFCIKSIETFEKTNPDTVILEWTVSFDPKDQPKRQIKKRTSPKIALNIRLGKGFVGTALPVLLEDMSFSGRMRVKVQFTSSMPHIRLVEACFMDKPQFHYVLKPIGGETFGFDVNNIPGLEGFVRDQVHAILGPMMYYPSVFSFNVEKFFAGELDLTQANGVLAITVHSCNIESSSENLNPFVRFYLDEAQELEKTSVCENSRAPIWNETRFILLNNLDSILALELRTENGIKKAGKKLAVAHFDLRDIQEQENMELDNMELAMLRHGRYITSLKTDMRYFPVSKPIYNPDGSVIEAEPSNSGILRVTIHECKNLGHTQVNPSAIIKINGIDRFETPTFKGTANPKYARSYESLILDKTEVHVQVRIVSHINFAEDKVIGVWSAYLHDIVNEQEKREFWWPLSLDDEKLPGSVRFSVQWKSVIMRGLAKMKSSGIYTPPVGVVRISLWEARNLVSRSVANNRQDAYVRVKSASQVRTRTNVVLNCENPEWGEHHYVPIHSIYEDLVLEVMDSMSNAKDKSLGSTILSLKDIITQNIYEDPNNPGLNTVLSLPKGICYAPDTNEDMTFEEDITTVSELPLVDVYGLPIKYTPDDKIDLSLYKTGVVTVRIHEVKLSSVCEVYCHVMVDSLLPQYQTKVLKGKVLAFNETTDAFVKDAGFSRVVIELKEAKDSDKDDERMGYWYNSSERIVRVIQRKARQYHPNELIEDISHEDESEWFPLLDMKGGSGQIRLSFAYTPLIDYKINSEEESLENQGYLTVTLLSAKDLRGVDKSGTSDPFVRFTINGEMVYKSAVIKKTLTPVWNNEKFEVPIASRSITSFRIEVFDWNQLSGDVPLGSGGLSLRNEMIESFVAQDYTIPLGGGDPETGSVNLRLKWEPRLLARQRTSSTFLSGSKRASSKLGMTAFNWGQPLERKESGDSLISKITGDSAVASESNDRMSTGMSDAGVPVNYRKGIVRITIIEARGLQDINMNPMVLVNLGGKQILKTKKTKKTTTPQWNENCVESVSGRGILLEIKVKDSHKFFNSDIGNWTDDLWNLINPPLVDTADRWISLYPENSGEVHVHIAFLPLESRV
ncbi:hypothetical protein BDB01DRAFT_882480 [Pilobolus umbonatus]|nr:hypothetical protein BDB01DRAFT_882480 [Pilobolus umbonatus]